MALTYGNKSFKAISHTLDDSLGKKAKFFSARYGKQSSFDCILSSLQGVAVAASNVIALKTASIILCFGEKVTSISISSLIL